MKPYAIFVVWLNKDVGGSQPWFALAGDENWLIVEGDLRGIKQLDRIASMQIENTIVQGDCIKVLKELLAGNNGEGFADLIFADPPFNIGYEYDSYEDKVDYKDYVEWTRAWMQRYKTWLFMASG